MEKQRHLDQELVRLKTNILKMAALVEVSINQSVESLKTRNIKLAEKIIADDQIIDELEIQIEEEIIEIFALFQPMATDLRFLATGMHINAELERIADLAVNICQRAIDLSSQPLLKPLVDIPKLANQAKWMVKSAIDAFVSNNENIAKAVIFSDKESNELRTAVMKELINDYMAKDTATVTRAVPLLLIARDLERICDHAAAISEDVIYMVNAKMIKHHRELLKEE